MTAFVALVRAANVAGTGRLPKDELARIGERCGLDMVRTFINSGNLLFTSRLAEAMVRRRLEERLSAYFGKLALVQVRSAADMARATRENPFKDDDSARVMAHFIDATPVKAMIDEARGAAGERLALGHRLLYVSYGDGIGRSKLKLPAASKGTARNMNSVERISRLLAEME